MKRIILTFSLFAFFNFVLSAQIEVPETQTTLITKISADWCPPCGGWGWDLFEGILEENTENAISIVAHYSGDLQTDVAKAFTTNLGASGQPRFFVNETDVNANSSNSATILESIKATVDANALIAPIAQTGLTATYTEDETTFTINTKTKFFQATTGSYYLGVYYLKKSIIAPQANQGNEANHHAILDVEVSTGGIHDFGYDLLSGDIPEGFTAESSFVFIENSGVLDYDNTEVVAVIWQKIDGKYFFVNANKVNFELAIQVNTKQLSQIEPSLIIQPNVVFSQFKMKFTTSEYIKNAEITLSNAQGQLIKVLHRGAINSGQQSFDFQRPDNTPAGIYFLKLYTNEGEITRRIVFD